MKKIISFTLAVLLLLSLAVTVCATDESREFFFELTADGVSEKRVQSGDIITVVFTLYRTDSEESYDMYAMQNEIRYDSEFFRLVEGTEMISDGISTTDIGLRDSFREFYMNFVSLFGGEKWNARRLVGSFQLQVIGTSGVTRITCQDYLVSTPDGQDSYAATCQDVTIILTTDCKMKIKEQKVRKGAYADRPPDPTREGRTFAGWFYDAECTERWYFETDKVEENMTLYAKWI